MKKMIYISLLVLLATSCKKDASEQAKPIAPVRGTLYDTLTKHSIPDCRVFLTETKNGRTSIIDETQTNELGQFQFDTLTSNNEIQFANNSYSWHPPQGLKQGKYWLKPYVEVQLKIDSMPGYIVKALRGGFNEAPIDSPQIYQNIPVTTPVFEKLQIKLIRQKYQGNWVYDTLYFNPFIENRDQIILLHE